MAVPKQVQKQTEAVQALYKDLNEEDSAPSPEGEAAPIQEVVSADSAEEVAPQPEPVEQGEGGQDDDYEQRWKTLQGMYNADTARLSTQNQELSGRLQQMEELISTMQATPAPTPEPEQPKSLLTEDEVEEYGESIDIMRKVSPQTITRSGTSTTSSPHVTL